MLEKLDLDLDSPRLKIAIENLGITVDELILLPRESFEKPGLNEDLVKIRYNHHRNRMFETVNTLIEERSRIKHEI